MIRALALCTLALCPSLSSASAQSSGATPPSQAPVPSLRSHADWPAGSAADTATIESIVHAFYNAISAPAGGKLDRTRLRSLFVPGGRIAVSLTPQGSHPADVLFLSPEQYAANSDSYTATDGFFDRNPANQIERFGLMAHVYSTYESRAHPEDAKPMARGIKSFELLNSNHRWYILEVYWDAERLDNPIPDRYLHDGPK